MTSAGAAETKHETPVGLKLFRREGLTARLSREVASGVGAGTRLDSDTVRGGMFVDSMESETL